MNCKMKKTALLLLTILISTSIYAQKDWSKKKEKMEAQKIAFITQHLDFNKAEAQNFWPVYNAQQKELEEIRKQRQKIVSNLHDRFEHMSNKEVENKILKLHDLDSKELDLKKKHYTELKSVISAKKIAQLYRAELLFKKELLGRIKDHNKKGGPPHRR